MNPSHSLLVLFICLSAQPSGAAEFIGIRQISYSLVRFRKIILCDIPGSRPVLDYADYGCYCGYGGCCQVHDNCYGDAMKHPGCVRFIDNPYTKRYKYSCDKASRAVTCLGYNSPCAMFVCECDRRAAMCFAKAPYIQKHAHLPKSRCK